MTADLPLTLDQFLDYLDVGEYDDELDEIRARVDERRERLLVRYVRTLKPGDELRLTDQASPKYLQGLTCTLLEIQKDDKSRTRLRVRMPDDPAYRKFTGSEKVLVPPSITERISK